MFCPVKQQSAHPSALTQVPCPLGSIPQGPQGGVSPERAPAFCFMPASVQQFPSAPSSAESSLKAKDPIWLALEGARPAQGVQGRQGKGPSAQQFCSHNSLSGGLHLRSARTFLYDSGHRKQSSPRQEEGATGSPRSELALYCIVSARRSMRP